MNLQGRLNGQLVNGVTVDLNDAFKAALGMLEGTDKNVFITGRAGTGKSTLLEYFRNTTHKSIAVLAPTGVAALNVKGQTIHSFFRFRPDITPDSVVKLQYRGMRMMYQKLEAIVIDEISMVRADLLDCIDAFMRLNGNDPSLPFGGVQMVFIGDMYQLSPVVTSEETEMFKGHYKSQYFFDAHCFKDFKMEFIELERHYRQTDKRFISLLNAIRNNAATDEHITELNSRYNPFFSPGRSDQYITLTTTNRLADEINHERLKKLQSVPYHYMAKSEGNFDKNALPADEELVVKVGMQVMLLNNDKHDRWVNGSIGNVISIDKGIEDPDAIRVELSDGSQVVVLPHTWELFKFSYDQKNTRLVPRSAGSFTQYPMMPAWAITIHKSQGKTFDRVIIDLGSGTFAHGQLYVALSRCRSLEGIVLKKRIEGKYIMMDERIVKFLSSFNG